MNRIYLFLLSILVSIGASAMEMGYAVKKNGNLQWKTVTLSDNGDGCFYSNEIQVEDGATWDQLYIYDGSTWYKSNDSQFTEGNDNGGDHAYKMSNNQNGNIDISKLDANTKYQFWVKLEDKDKKLWVLKKGTVFPSTLYIGVDNGSGTWKFNQTGIKTGDVTTFDVEFTGNPAWFTFTSATGNETDYNSNKPNMWGPTDGNAIIISEGQPRNISKNENCFQFTGGAGSYTITVNHTTGLVTIAESNGFPKTLYIGYQADGSNWSFNHAGTKNDNITTFRINITGTNGGGILFTSEEFIGNYWDHLDIMWGADPSPVANNYIDVYDGVKSYTLFEGSEMSYNIQNGGTYDVMVDHSNGTFKIKKVVVSYPKPIYLAVDRKGDGNWKFNYTGTYDSSASETYFDVDFYTNPAYFTFTSAKGDATNYDSNKANIWGPAAPNQEITSGENSSISRNENCFKLTYGAGKYRITFNHNTGAVSIFWVDYARIPSGYYFYGDMNRWSCTANAGMTITGTGSSIDFIGANPADIWGDDAPNQKFLSEDEINEYWQFYSCEGEILPDVLYNTPGTWYKLDFTDLSDDMGNVGRLCGQFKITKGWTSQATQDKGEDENQWGMGENNNSTVALGVNENYVVNCAVKINDSQTYGVWKGKGKGNLHLDCSYVDNAVLYFNPTANQIYITGDPKYIYAYYSVAQPEGSTVDFSAPSEAKFADLSQKLYYVNTPSWNNPGDTSFNRNGIYNWEEVDVNTLYDAGVRNNVTINTEVYRKAYRKLLPLGASHRFPVEFNATVTRRDGSWFPAQRVRCADIFFFEADPVDVYFRYEDEHLPAWVRTNAYIETFDSQSGLVTGRKYFASGNDDASKWLKTEIVTAKRPGEHNAYEWFKTVTQITGDFVSGSYALFQTAEPLSYPLGGIYAQGLDKTETKINGDNLWYVVPCGHDRDHNIEILYSHLKGTYQLGTDHATRDFQINAELFDSEGNLDTTFHGDVTYSFEVFKTQADGSLLRVWHRTFDEGDEVHGDNSKYAPYFNISAEQIANHGAGWYQVKVQVKKGTETYTAYDVYPVFPAE